MVFQGFLFHIQLVYRYALGAAAVLHDAQALPAGDDVRGDGGRLQEVGGVGALAAAAAGAGGGDVQRRRAGGGLHTVHSVDLELLHSACMVSNP